METSDFSVLAAPPSQIDRARNDAELGRTDFLRMLVAQLENQDPLNPQDGTEFTAQLAQFSQLEQLISMRSSIENLAKTFSAEQGSGVDELTRGLLLAGIIGKDIFYKGSEFEVEPTATGTPAPNIRLAFDLHGNTSNTTLRIFDELGIEVGTIDRGRLSQGQYEVYWDGIFQDGTSLAPGSYSFRVDAKNGTQVVGTERYVGGYVSGTSMNGGDPTLMVGNLTVAFKDVLEIRDGSSGP